MRSICGIDFGTSNSTIGVIKEQHALLLPLEHERASMPSALFYNFNDRKTCYGSDAIRDYIDGEYGRFMRSLKTILGTSLMSQSTQFGQRLVSYQDIIADFIAELKKRAEMQAGENLISVVAGRPVHFIDGDREADQLAQRTLAEIYRTVGFAEVEFQFEPIAAAIHYEQQITGEELALIVDIGGGTSDFTIIRLSPDRARATDRYGDILATTGVHIGGNDFDRSFNIDKAMPVLGLNSYLEGSTRLPMPKSPYFDLATWHLIHQQYDRVNIHNFEQLKLRAEQPKLIDRMLKLLRQQDGHRLIAHVERCKIDLTENLISQLDLTFIEAEFLLACHRDEFETATNKEISQIAATITQTLAQAGISSTDINSVFLTGGTTGLPSVRRVVREFFPDSQIVEGDRFGSVGLGLALDAMRRFA